MKTTLHASETCCENLHVFNALLDSTISHTDGFEKFMRNRKKSVSSPSSKVFRDESANQATAAGAVDLLSLMIVTYIHTAMLAGLLLSVIQTVYTRVFPGLILYFLK